MKPGEVIEILPGDIRPARYAEAGIPFNIHEPIALLPGPTAADVDVITAMSRGVNAAAFRVHTDQSGRTTVVQPDDVALTSGKNRLRWAVSSAARSADGTTWFMNNPAKLPSGTPRVWRVPRNGEALQFADLTGLQLSRDRVRLTTLPDGRVGYLADGRPRALPRVPGPVPALGGIDRLTATGAGGYLAAVRTASQAAIQIVRVGADGSRKTFTIPPSVRPGPLRSDHTKSALPTFHGTVVALTPDGQGGAYVAVASKLVDDALGVDYSAGSMLLRVRSEGETTLLTTGDLTSSRTCPDWPSSTRLEEMESNLGRITDLSLHGDQLWIADAACRRVLSLRTAEP